MEKEAGVKQEPDYDLCAGYFLFPGPRKERSISSSAAEGTTSKTLETLASTLT